MKKARGSQEISEAYHQFQYHLVLFRLFRYAVFGIEVFLVVQPEVCAECLAEAEGDAARQALAFVSVTVNLPVSSSAVLASLWSVIMS